MKVLWILAHLDLKVRSALIYYNLNIILDKIYLIINTVFILQQIKI